MDAAIRQRVNRRFAAQYGLITRSQALAAGLSRDQVSRRLASGEWMRASASVYRSVAAPIADLQPLLAAVLSFDGWASHRSARHLHGLADLPGVPELIIPRTARAPVDVVAFRSRSLPFRATRRRGVPTLDVAGALVTSAEVLTPDALATCVSLAVTRRLIHPGRVLAELEVLRGRRNIGALRNALGCFAVLIDQVATALALRKGA